MSNTPASLAELTRAAPAATPRATPSVPLPRFRWKTRVLLPGAIIAATATILLIAAADILRPAVPVQVVPVVTKTGVATASAGAAVVQAPGWVEADPYATSVSALADGIVEEVLVLEGQPVQAGQVVARLVDEDAQLALNQAEAALALKQAQLQVMQATLTEAQRNWDHPIELERKRAASRALLAAKQALLERWPAELASQEAQAIYAKAEWDRVRPLHAAGQTSDIELIKAEQAYHAQAAMVDATRRQEAVLKSEVAALQAEVDAADEDLKLRITDTRKLDEARATVARAEADVAAAVALRDTAKLRLDRMQVRSPATGIVMNRLAEPGSKLMLNADNPQSAWVLRVYDPQHLQVRVDVPLVDAAKVGVGQAAEVVVDVLPDRVFQGRVTRVVHEADIQKNTQQVKVAILDPSPELAPEMLARAKFLATAAATSNPSGARLFIPANLAHRMDGGQAHVWIADQARNVAQRRLVTLTNAQHAGWLEVASGLQPGDRLIADPPASLREGQALRIVGEVAGDAAMSGAGGSAHEGHGG